jgi:hypothetical protein
MRKMGPTLHQNVTDVNPKICKIYYTAKKHTLFRIEYCSKSYTVLMEVDMRLVEISGIQSGYIARSKIEACADGSHYLLQAKDLDADQLAYRTEDIIRFNPSISRKDWILAPGDILFMARGARNFSILVKQLPQPTLAAACFFIVRANDAIILPAYLCWYLNQLAVQHYLIQHSGRGVHMPVVRRVVLESIEIPVLAYEQQKKIAALDTLMSIEQRLFQKLGQKRKELITAACLSATRLG